MSITISFLGVVAGVLVGGTLYRRWDESRNLRFTDEAGSGASTLALARFEARQVLTHPTWLITLAFCAAIVVLLITVVEPGSSFDDDIPVSWFTIISLPLAGLALVVSAHRIGTRSRRNRTDELEASTPTAPRTRTTSLLIACLAPLPVFVAVAVFAIVASQIAYPFAPNATASSVVPLAGFVLPGVGGAVVGVLLSRWLPFAVAPLLGIVAIIWLNNGPDHLHPRFRWLRVGVEGARSGRFDIRPYGLLACFIGGLIVLGACLALWRHPPRPQLVVATLAVGGLVAAIGWTMTRSPSPGEVASVVDQLENPGAHQHCETRRSARYCAYRGAESWIDAWAPAVERTLAQVAPTARPTSIDVVQRPLVDPGAYLPTVRSAIDPTVVWRRDGQIHPLTELDGSRPDLLVAWGAAALAVGLPPSVDWEHPTGCMAGGQARLVLAHLLAARATATTREAFRATVTFVRDGSTQLSPAPIDVTGDSDADTKQTEGSEINPGDRIAADGVTPIDYLTAAGASGWGTDILAVDDLLRADQEAVDVAIADHWDELIDPSTPTARFLQLAGRSAAGLRSPRTLTTEPHACP